MGHLGTGDLEITKIADNKIYGTFIEHADASDWGCDIMVFRLTVMIRLLFRARNIIANGMKITIKRPSTQLNFS